MRGSSVELYCGGGGIFDYINSLIIHCIFNTSKFGDMMDMSRLWELNSTERDWGQCGCC